MRRRVDRSGAKSYKPGVSERAPLTLVRGDGPLVLVAPHGGRRDAVRRPWASGHLRMNDLHTAALTAELAALIGAAALINETHDRNDVDLNRVSAAAERAPWFLERLAELLDGAVRRHGHATLLALHGWNVVQPVVDLGLGCTPGEDPFAVGRGAAVSPAFAADALPRLVDACRACGIAVTVGARYPARGRENLVQLFTPRYAEDGRPLVRALAALAPHVDAVQLELGISLRWPGAWRDRLIEACAATLPALAAGASPARTPARAPVGGDPARLVARRLEFASPALSGLVGLDAGRTGRLLLFPADGGLVLFTGERLGLEPPGVAGGLHVQATEDGGLDLRYDGPLLRFPDTTPFLDLETGLARAELIEGEIALRFSPGHADGGAAEFGAVSGSVSLDGAHQAVAARGFGETGNPGGPWPRLRAALDLGGGAHLALTLALPAGEASGFLCRDRRHVPVTAARVALGPAAAPLADIALDLELGDGGRLRVGAHALHSLPVIRNAGHAPVRIEFAACFLDGVGPAGWVELGGV
jgi:hypothetical protein